MRNHPKDLQQKRWLRALTIAKILFEDQGYHTQYLVEIETLIKGDTWKGGGD